MSFRVPRDLAGSGLEASSRSEPLGIRGDFHLARNRCGQVVSLVRFCVAPVLQYLRASPLSRVLQWQARWSLASSPKFR